MTDIEKETYTKVAEIIMQFGDGETEFNTRDIDALLKIIDRLQALQEESYLTLIEFRAYDRDACEPFLTPEPLVGHALKTKLEKIVNTAVPKRVFRYAGTGIKLIGTTHYDERGEIIPHKPVTPTVDEKK